jgi:hypothetical protein
MTDKQIPPTVPASHRLRALAEDTMPLTIEFDGDAADAQSAWLDMAAGRLAQAIIESGDSSLLTVLAKGYIEHLMEEEHAKEERHE